jgi:hypothetical protein
MMGRRGEGVFNPLGLMWLVPPEEKVMPTNKTFRGRIPLLFRQSIQQYYIY